MNLSHCNHTILRSYAHKTLISINYDQELQIFSVSFCTYAEISQLRIWSKYRQELFLSFKIFTIPNSWINPPNLKRVILIFISFVSLKILSRRWVRFRGPGDRCASIRNYLSSERYRMRDNVYNWSLIITFITNEIWIFIPSFIDCLLNFLDGWSPG